MKRARGRLGDDVHAVSAVIGAVMIMAIGVSTFVAIQVEFVPQWEKEKEAKLTLEVEDQLATLMSALDRMQQDQTEASIGTRIGLAPEDAFMGSGGVGNSIAFEPSAVALDIQAAEFKKTVVDDIVVSDESWTTVGSFGDPIEDITDILDWRILLHGVSQKDEGKSTILKIRDTNDNLLGTFTVYIRKDGETWIMKEALDADNNVLYDQGQEFKLKSKAGLDDYWVDILDPEYRFDRVVADAAKPLKIVMNDDGLEAEYAIAYKTSTGGERVIGVGSNDPISLQKNIQGGRIAYESRNTYFPDQTYSLENGGLVLSQSDTDEAMRVEPDFQVTAVGSTVDIKVGLAALDGDETHLSGKSSAQVIARVTDRSNVAGEAPSITINATTPYPVAYEAFWDSALVAAGLTSTDCATPSEDCHYEITTGTDWAKLVVYGFTVVDADPNNPAYDVALTINETEVDIRLLP